MVPVPGAGFCRESGGRGGRKRLHGDTPLPPRPRSPPFVPGDAGETGHRVPVTWSPANPRLSLAAGCPVTGRALLPVGGGGGGLPGWEALCVGLPLPSLPNGSRFLSPSIRLKRGLSLRSRRHCPLASSSRLTSAYTLLPSSRTTKVYMAAVEEDRTHTLPYPTLPPAVRGTPQTHEPPPQPRQGLTRPPPPAPAPHGRKPPPAAGERRADPEAEPPPALFRAGKEVTSRSPPPPTRGGGSRGGLTASGTEFPFPVCRCRASALAQQRLLGVSAPDRHGPGVAAPLQVVLRGHGHGQASVGLWGPKNGIPVSVVERIQAQAWSGLVLERDGTSLCTAARVVGREL